MRSQGQHRFATSFFFAGLLAVLLSLGGGWGDAYGQTAGPTPTPADVALSIAKSVDQPTAQPGDTVVFTIRVQHVGNAPAQNAVVQDDIPSAFELLSASSSAGTVAVSGPTVRVTIPQLNPGETVIITVTARIRPDARGSLSNTASVTAIGVSGVQLPPQTATAGLSVSGESGADDSAGNDEDGASGVVRSGAEADNGTGLKSQLSNTGVDAGLQWPLFIIGVLFVIAGSVLFARSRKTT